MSQKYFKASEVAKELGVESVTVRSWLKRGLFPNAKLEETIAGSIWLIPKSDLESFEKPKTGRPTKKA